jgi:hypothetical protein
VLSARVTSLAGLAQRMFFWDFAGPSRQFDAVLKVDEAGVPLLPGTSARVVVAGAEIRDALHVARQAIFEKNGKPVVYAKSAAGFEPREVQVKHRTESQVEISGLPEGTVVALVNPETSHKPPSAATPGPASAAGAGR